MQLRLLLALTPLFGGLFLAGCTANYPVTTCNESLCLDLSYFEEESSEDSNSTLETLNVQGQEVIYTWEYEGYTPSDDYDSFKEATFTLTDEEFEGLKQLLEDTSLLTPVEEIQTLSSDGAMASHSVDMTLKIDWGDQTVYSHIVGLTDIYSGNGESSSNVENAITLSDAQQVVSFIKNAEGFVEE